MSCDGHVPICPVYVFCVMSCFRHTRTGRPKHHKSRQMRQQIRLQWLQRITEFSYPRPFIPKNERSLWRTFVPQELSFPRPFVPGNFRSRGTKVPWNFRSRALSFSGTFVPGEQKFLGTFVPETFRTRELSFPLSDRPSRHFALCA